MKSLRTILPLTALLAVTTAFVFPDRIKSLTAGQAGPVAVKLKKLDVIIQTSPKYDPDLVVMKRIPRAKKWLEFEVEFEADKKLTAGATSPFIDDLLFKYYVAFKHKDPTTGKNVMATGQVNHVNIEPREVTHSSMYISPSSASRVRMRIGEAGKTDVEGFAVQVLYQGQIIAEDSTYAKASRWWATGVLPPKDGLLVPRSDTPFAPLWYDYFAEARKDR